jgi:outer membrane protein TolC
MLRDDTNPTDPETLALAALGWTLVDEARAQRLLALTGLDPAALRERIDEPRLLASVLAFLEAHEPDLLAAAEALDVAPAALVAARRRLEQ